MYGVVYEKCDKMNMTYIGYSQYKTQGTVYGLQYPLLCLV